jgi:uncharacterized membrane protein
MMTDPPSFPPTDPVPGSAHQFQFNRPTIVSLLYLASFLTLGVSGLVGLVLAYAWRNERHEAWEQSHFTFLIRTFWLGLGFAVICALLAIFALPLPLLGFLAIGVWIVVRSVMALAAAQKHAPIRYPLKLLW